MRKTMVVPPDLAQWRRDELSNHFTLDSDSKPQAAWGYVEWCQERGIGNMPGVETVALMAQHYGGSPIYVGPSENAKLSATELFFIKSIDVKSGPPAKVRPGIATAGFHGDIAVHQPWTSKPDEEWRTWVRDGVILEATRYSYASTTYAYNNGKDWPKPAHDVLTCVHAYVLDIVQDLPIHMQGGAVIDVMVLNSSKDHPPSAALVEVNCPNSSDWYGADIAKIAPLLLV